MHVSSGGLPGMTRGSDVNHAVVVLGRDLHRLAAVDRAGIKVLSALGAPHRVPLRCGGATDHQRHLAPAGQGEAYPSA